MIHGGLKLFDLAAQCIPFTENPRHAEQIARCQAVGCLWMEQLAAHETEAFELRVDVHQFTR